MFPSEMLSLIPTLCLSLPHEHSRSVWGFPVPPSSLWSHWQAKPESESEGMLHILDLEGGGFGSAYSSFSR